jgi:hypothetical protein
MDTADGGQHDMPIPILSGPYRTFRDLNPDETYVEYEGSTITIPIRAQLPGGKWEEERLKLRAYMRVEGLVRQRWPDVDFQTKAIPYLTGSILADVVA